MPTYIALLRAVNVAGNMVKMERVRQWCIELGWQNVRTYVQSGNVVFESGDRVTVVQQVLEAKLAGETKRAITVIARTAADLERVLKGNPFLAESGIDRSRLYVTFLQSAPGPRALEALASMETRHDRFAPHGKEIYLHCPSGYGQTKLSNQVFEKRLGVRATTRNWNTVNQLVEMTQA